MKRMVDKKNYVCIIDWGRAAQKCTCAHKRKNIAYGLQLNRIDKTKYNVANTNILWTNLSVCFSFWSFPSGNKKLNILKQISSF